MSDIGKAFRQATSGGEGRVYRWWEIALVVPTIRQAITAAEKHERRRWEEDE